MVDVKERYARVEGNGEVSEEERTRMEGIEDVGWIEERGYDDLRG